MCSAGRARVLATHRDADGDSREDEAASQAVELREAVSRQEAPRLRRHGVVVVGDGVGAASLTGTQVLHGEAAEAVKVA